MGMSTYKGYFEAWELEGGKSVESGLKKRSPRLQTSNIILG